MSTSFDQTVKFDVRSDEVNEAERALMIAYQALRAKGYNPINQLVGYLLSGDPSYITSHEEARNVIRRVERDDLMEELVRSYLSKHT